MTHLDVGLGDPTISPRRQLDLRRAQLELESLVVERLGFDLSRPPCPRHVSLLELAIREKATILSLNYDLVLEHALAMPGGDMPFAAFRNHSRSLLREDHVTGWEELGSGRHLQLHGALNWWRCPNRNCRENQRVHVEPFGEAATWPGYVLSPSCRDCGHQRQRVIVPPTMKGVFGTLGRLAFLWRIARDALASAKRAIVIGASFPPSDYVLLWLIREAYSPMGSGPLDLVIVNPCEADARRALSVFSLTSGCWFRSFDDFLKEDHGVDLDLTHSVPAP